MFDYKSIPTDDELKVHFEASEIVNILTAVDNATGQDVGLVTLEGGTFTASDDNIFMQYKLWQVRPERKVGKKVEIAGKNMEELIEEYEELFIGAYIMQTKKPVTREFNMFARALDWLRETDFYTAPASTQYHDSFPGGLLVHTLRVYNQVVDLLQLPAFRTVNVEEITIAALVHDWCKIKFYEMYQKNVKDDETGKWHQEPAYRVNQKGIPLGHGTTSLFLASRVIVLTPEQALAIRWHMSRYNVCDKEENEFQNAVNDYPMVYMLQIADQLACNPYANREGE